MRKYLFKISISLCMCSLFFSASLFAAGPTIAVPRFTLWTIEHKGKVTDESYNTASPSGLSSYRKTEIQIDEDTIKEIEVPNLTDAFIRNLSSSSKFTVVERSKVDKILNEIKMGQDGLIDKASLVNKGKMLGATYLAIGTLIYADADVEYKPVPYTNQFYRIEKGLIKVDLRMLETETGKIVTAQIGEGKIENKVMVSSQTKEKLTKTFYLDLQEALALDLSTKIVDALYPFKIILVKEKTITADRGKNYQIIAGDVYEVIHRKAPIKDQDTGEIIAYDEVIVGTVKISDVQDKSCKAEIIEVKEPISNGDMLRKQGANN